MSNVIFPGDLTSAYSELLKSHALKFMPKKLEKLPLPILQGLSLDKKNPDVSLKMISLKARSAITEFSEFYFLKAIHPRFNEPGDFIYSSMINRNPELKRQIVSLYEESLRIVYDSRTFLQYNDTAENSKRALEVCFKFVKRKLLPIHRKIEKYQYEFEIKTMPETLRPSYIA